MKLWLLAMILALTTPAQAKPVLPTWTRAPGPATAPDSVPPAGAVPLDLTALRTQREKLYDVQYGEELWYRGAPLAALLERSRRGPGIDTALLRFDNGMSLSVPSRPDPKSGPFLALAWSKDGKAWSTKFPEVPKKGHTGDDPRPIRFADHKLVYRGEDARALPEWSPWRHLSSLLGLEWVNGAAYERQFDVSEEPVAKTGRALFRHYCEACHGVRGVGSRFGWDVVTPVALFQHRRNPGQLYYHVKYRELDAAQRGFMMPSFAPFTEDQASALWSWMKAAAEKPLLPYTPGPHSSEK